ncbi:GRIP domain, partial [Dillenia turbinata]
MKAENDVSLGQHIQKELDELKLRYEKLKEEHYSFHELANRMIGEKDKEISRLIDDNKNLHQSWELKPRILARQQAQRDEELAQSQRHILALQVIHFVIVFNLRRRKSSSQPTGSNVEGGTCNMERSQRREGVDMTYLKNVILKLLETGEVEALLPVIGMLLQFSPEEMQKCHQAYHDSKDAQSPANDTSVSDFPDQITLGLQNFWASLKALSPHDP